ncbi:MAG: hypothetical protein JXB48_23540, partial [Candidatus Latescibacteria bacterium]|nr:hypothetical protein [Candidatus Latescibacterota bacterium]
MELPNQSQQPLFFDLLRHLKRQLRRLDPGTIIILEHYNYPQKLDRAIRCMVACKRIEEARQNAQ